MEGRIQLFLWQHNFPRLITYIQPVPGNINMPAEGRAPLMPIGHANWFLIIFPKLYPIFTLKNVCLNGGREAKQVRSHEMTG